MTSIWRNVCLSYLPLNKQILFATRAVSSNGRAVQLPGALPQLESSCMARLRLAQTPQQQRQVIIQEAVARVSDAVTRGSIA